MKIKDKIEDFVVSRVIRLHSGYVIAATMLLALLILLPVEIFLTGNVSPAEIIACLVVSFFTTAIILSAFRASIKKLVESVRVTQAANLSKTLFLANVSHDIRTPLNSILGFTTLLNDTALNIEQKQYATNIAHSSEILLKLVNDVSVLSRIEAGVFNVKQKLFSVRDVVASATATGRTNLQQSGKSLSLIAQIEGGVSEYMVGAPVLIEQVLNNFVSNAIKYSEQGSIELWVEKPRPGFVRYSVRDTGSGIPLDMQPTVFSPQYHSDSEGQADGMGLGLSLSKQLVESMGGTIGVESNKPKGSYFYFDLPIIEAPDEPVLASVQSTDDLPIATHSKPMHILIAEDNQANRLVLAKMLQKEHHQILIAGNGEEAIAKWRDHAALDLILMDVQMPVMDGLEAIRQIRTFEERLGRDRIPIIVISATETSDEADRARECGADAYLVKPIDRKLLLETIARYAIQS